MAGIEPALTGATDTDREFGRVIMGGSHADTRVSWNAGAKA
jgi:hypothetical protein